VTVKPRVLTCAARTLKEAAMSWTRSIAPETAPPELRGIYDRIRERSTTGRVSNVWQALALQPAVLDAAYTSYRTLTDDPAPLTPAQAEAIVLVVSATNGCGYCVAHHGPKLAALVGEELAHAVARDYREANLAARDRVLLDMAVAITCEPGERGVADLERVREYGFGDDAIVKAVAIAGWYSFINRVVLALGVELEHDRTAWEFGAQR
jgi:uncharacterized peroxidase-related enzyme